MPEKPPDLSQAIRQQEQLNRVSAEFAKLSFDDQIKMVEKFSKKTGIASKTLKGMTTQAAKLSTELENIKGDVEKLGIEKGLDAKQMKKYIDEADKLKYIVESLADIKRLNEGIWSTEAVEQFNKKLEENGEELEKHGVDIEKIKELNAEAWNEESITIVTKVLGEMTNKVGQLRVEIDATADSFVAFGKQSSAPGFSKLTEGYGVIKDMGSALKGSPKQLQEQAKRAGDVGLEFKRWGKHFAETKAMGGALGGMFKSLGGTIGGISKLLGGWPGLIAMAAVKLVDAVMKIDKFVKDANKAFAMVRGPDIMTGKEGVAKQFREFNDQIFNIRENLKVGLNVDQIREFMLSVSQAGLQVQSFNNGINDYRDAIEIAARASRVMAIELPQVGAMMGELVTNFRMDLDEIDRSFVQVTFDAKKSGLTTDRFWGAIQNASAGLAYYGKFLNAASRSMKSLTESQVVGADQATTATQEMFQLFKKNSYGTNAAIIALSKKHGVNFNKIIKENITKAEAEIKKLEGQIEVNLKSGASEEELTKLRKQMAVAETGRSRDMAILNKNAVVQATDMARYSDQAPGILMDLIMAVTGAGDVDKLTGEKLIIAIETLQKLGVSEETTRVLITQQQASNKYLQNIFTGSDGFYTKLMKIGEKEAKDLVAGFNTLNKNMTEDDLAKAIRSQAKLLEKTYGIDSGMAQSVALSAASDKTMNSQLQAIITETANGNMGEEEARSQLGNLLKQQKVGEKYTRLGYKVNEIGEEERKAAADKAFDEIVNQTLSLEEMKKIAEDGVKWNLATLARMDKMASGVTWIARSLAKRWGNRDPETERVEKRLLELTKTVKVGGGIFGTSYLQAGGGRKDKEGYLETLAGSFGDKKDLEKRNQNIIEGLAQVEKDIVIARRSKDGDALEEAKDRKKALLKQKEQTEAELKKTAEIVENTKALIEKDEKIAKSLMWMIKGDQRSTNAIVSEIAESLPEVTTLAKIESKMKSEGLDPSSVTGKRAIQNLWQQDGSEFKRRSQKDAETRMANISKQGLATPELVTRPGAVVLHNEEMILPSDYSNFKARPIREPEGAVGAPANVSKNINITVNATETNLANRIANEIRSHLYREQLSGAA